MRFAIQDTFSAKAVCCIFMFIMILHGTLFSQITGMVKDAQSREPLAFVHILAEGTRQGTMTDIDGHFSIDLPDNTTRLKLSYVGYFDKTYKPEISDKQHIIHMYRRPYDLQEVVVYPGENPAHRIIRNTIDNKSSNDPERLNSFTYNSYNKFVATLDKDYYMKQWLATGDSVHKRFIDMLDERHLFVMESVTQRKYLSPGRNNEEVIANRVSGLQNPMFTMLATELQSFTFYGNYITLLDHDFISPLNSAAFNRYSYQLEDTLFQEMDTVFVLRYNPHKNTNFDGLSGLLYINTNGWAIQNVIAEPTRNILSGLRFKIQQKYEQINGQHWFPVQLNTDIEFFNPQARGGTIPLRMLSRSYIRDIDTRANLQRSDFSPYTVDFDPQANSVSNQFWHTYQPEELSDLEKNTYHHMDSLGKAHNFDRLFNVMEPIAFGEVPLGLLNLDLRSLYQFNDFERHRIGVGLQTNRHLSERFMVGGHYAWATGDRQNKYGYWGEMVLNPKHDIRLGGSFKFDVSERGSRSFMEQRFLLDNQFIRNLYINTMDYTREVSGYFTFSAIRQSVQTEISFSRGKTSWGNDYAFSRDGQQPGISQFRFARAGLRLRFAWGETLMNTPTRVIRIPSHYPVFYLNMEKGFDIPGHGQLEYLRLEARADITYPIPLLGRQNWIVEGGWTDRPNLPWSLLFTARAGNSESFIATPFSFGTMQMNEFIADRYVAVFFQHNFESLLFRTKNYNPELLLISNLGWGRLDSPQYHLSGDLQGWEKGFFESGLAINKILPRSWVRKVVYGFSPGVEVLYRYGPYAFPSNSDNLTVKLVLQMTL